LKSERKMKGLHLGLFEACKRRREKGAPLGRVAAA